MNYPAFLKNDTHKPLWNFDIQTDHLILARRPNLIKTKNKNMIVSVIPVVVGYGLPGLGEGTGRTGNQ